jgi:beta-xylosidase
VARKPMDPDVFTDDDGQKYLYFGGTQSNAATLNDDMISFRLLDEFQAPTGNDSD